MKAMAKVTNTLETVMDRREALKFLGCAACALVSVSLLETQVEAQTNFEPFQVAAQGELTTSGQYSLFKIERKPIIVYASDTEVENSLKWGDVWLVAYSRSCTHRQATIREPNDAGVMHCPEHRQDFDTKTGEPVGPVHRAKKPLEQFGLEQRPNQTVWLTQVVRPV
jgi:nitrite reductase/ring-hydroxylating ferredoxin subunit